jgi:hypothetical protein
VLPAPTSAHSPHGRGRGQREVFGVGQAVSLPTGLGVNTMAWSYAGQERAVNRVISFPGSYG